MTWATRMVPGHAPDGGHILSVLAKKTYTIAHQQVAVEDLESPIGLFEADVYWGSGNPKVDAVQVESDLVAYKPCVDFIVVGSAHAPRGKRAKFFDVGMQIGTAVRMLRVFGNRTVQVKSFGFEFSEPEAFDSMPLHYGLAYGGTDTESEPGTTCTYSRNPIGKGFIVKKEPKALHGLVLPNLEDPRQVLTPETLVLGKFQDWERMPQPQAFSPTGKNFHPRLDLAGLPMDDRSAQEWERQKTVAAMPEVGAGADSVPAAPTPVLNPLFYNGAPEGQRFPFLRGDETIRLSYMDPDFPLFEFKLPMDVPSLFLEANDEGPEELAAVLQTVVVHKETNQVTLLWRGSCYYGGPEAMADWTGLEYGVLED
ncbi:MAG: hypothetical protein RL173_1912 [Fibrobacterota bacterium]|jgi:hypothetical protein